MKAIIAFLIAVIIVLAATWQYVDAAPRIPFVREPVVAEPAGLWGGVCLCVYRYRPVGDPYLQQICEQRNPDWDW